MKQQTKKGRIYALLIVCTISGFLLADSATGRHHIVHAAGAVTVTVSSDLAGAGTITSTDHQINCGGTCSGTYTIGQSVTLNFTPATGFSFIGWSAPCDNGSTNTSTTCTYTVRDPVIWNDTKINNTTAVVAYSTYNVTVTKLGTGSGTVTGAGKYNLYDTITLVATPDANSVFTGWQAADNDYYICAGVHGKGGGDPVVGGRGGQITPDPTLTVTNPTCVASTGEGGPQTIPAYPQFDLKPGYVAPASPSSGSSKTPPKTTAAAPAPVTTADGTPTAPTPTITLAGSTIGSTDKPMVEANKPLVLSGTTVPNGVVNIYVFSTPHKYTVTADKNGKWSYIVATSGLPAGSHHIEATVTDPATGKTSPRSQVLAFTLAKATLPGTATASHPSITKHTSALMIIDEVIPVLVILVALVIGYLWKFQQATLSRILQWLHLKKRGNTNNLPGSPPIS